MILKENANGGIFIGPKTGLPLFKSIGPNITQTSGIDIEAFGLSIGPCSVGGGVAVEDATREGNTSVGEIIVGVTDDVGDPVVRVADEEGFVHTCKAVAVGEWIEIGEAVGVDETAPEGWIAVEREDAEAHEGIHVNNDTIGKRDSTGSEADVRSDLLSCENARCENKMINVTMTSRNFPIFVCKNISHSKNN